MPFQGIPDNIRFFKVRGSITILLNRCRSWHDYECHLATRSYYGLSFQGTLSICHYPIHADSIVLEND